ncbi:hypothetical protein D9M68_213800 [compost metagenome]
MRGGLFTFTDESPKPRQKLPLDHEHLDFTRQLRKTATDAEHLLWRHLRARQLAGRKFRRQHPVPPYVLDFFCREIGLAIEVDGGQHFDDDGVRRDGRRDAFLAGQGIRVLRFSSREVLVELAAVLERIVTVVQDCPSPQPSPEGRGG